MSKRSSAPSRRCCGNCRPIPKLVFSMPKAICASLRISAANCAPPVMCATSCARSATRKAIAEYARSAAVRAGGDGGIVQPRDLAIRKTEHPGEYLIGVLAEARRRVGRLARRCAEFKRQARHRIAADPGLLDCGEERV